MSASAAIPCALTFAGEIMKLLRHVCSDPEVRRLFGKEVLKLGLGILLGAVLMFGIRYYQGGTIDLTVGPEQLGALAGIIAAWTASVFYTYRSLRSKILEE